MNFGVPQALGAAVAPGTMAVPPGMKMLPLQLRVRYVFCQWPQLCFYSTNPGMILMAQQQASVADPDPFRYKALSFTPANIAGAAAERVHTIVTGTCFDIFVYIYLFHSCFKTHEHVVNQI